MLLISGTRRGTVRTAVTASSEQDFTEMIAFHKISVNNYYMFATILVCFCRRA